MIVTGVDFSADSRSALAWALAEGAARGDRVVALHAGPPTSSLVAHSARVEERHVDTQLRLASLLGELGAVDATPVVADGHPATVLVEGSSGAALLVVGRRGLGAVAAVLVGSVSHDVVRQARCPVAVVPVGPVVAPLRVVVGVDGSAPSEAAARWAATEAAARHVRLVVLHAMPSDDPDDAEEARRLLARTVALLAHDGLHVVPQVAGGSAGRALVEAARSDDLLVVGTHGYGAAARLLLGSTAAYCVEHSAGPVVVVPSP